MSKTAQHLSIILLISIMLALVGYGGAISTAAFHQATQVATAAGGQAANLPAARPVIRAAINDKAVDGTLGSYCWPSSDASPQCNFIEDVQPDTPINVAEGTDLKFQLEPASPAPQEFRATLPDDKGADGNPIRIDLAKSGGTYKVTGLAAGGHPVLVEAFYPGDSAESQFYVSYVFLLQVGTVTVMLPTETGTPAATAAATEVSTPQPTVVEVTQPAQPTQDVFSTPEFALPTVESPTAEATSTELPTVEAATTELPTVEPPTAEATTELPTIEPPTPELPTIAPPTIVLPTVLPPTPTPPPTTVVPSTVESPTPVPPTVVPLSSPPTGVAVEPTATSVTPNLILVVAGRNYDPVAINACVLSADGTQTCVTRPFNAASERIFAAAGDTAQIVFRGPRPTGINISVLSADAVSVLSKQPISPDNLSLYALPTNAGNYVLAVEVLWPAGKATYYYRLTVNS